MNNTLENYQKTRSLTTELIKNLEPEDTVVQPKEFVSPPKWHLAHTTWFFENFILKKNNFMKNFKFKTIEKENSLIIDSLPLVLPLNSCREVD